MTLQTCKKCGAEKPPDQFYWDTSRGVAYRRKTCKECEKLRSSQYMRDHREERVAYNLKYRANNPDKVRRYKRDDWLKHKYGIDESTRSLMLEAQGGRCAICRREEGGRPLHVDHNHTTGGVRMLLCDGCNLGLGFFSDSPELMRVAREYLLAHQ